MNRIEMWGDRMGPSDGKGIVTRIPPTQAEIDAFRKDLQTGVVQPLFPVKKPEADEVNFLHARALEEERQSTHAVTQRILNEGNPAKVFPGK